MLRATRSGARLAVGQGLNKDLVLVGYTLGASIAPAVRLDYPDEVKGIVIMTSRRGPRRGRRHLRDARARCGRSKPTKMAGVNRHAMFLVEQACVSDCWSRHRQIGPLSQLETSRRSTPSTCATARNPQAKLLPDARALKDPASRRSTRRKSTRPCPGRSTSSSTTPAFSTTEIRQIQRAGCRLRRRAVSDG